MGRCLYTGRPYLPIHRTLKVHSDHPLAWWWLLLLREGMRDWDHQFPTPTRGREEEAEEALSHYDTIRRRPDGDGGDDDHLHEKRMSEEKSVRNSL